MLLKTENNLKQTQYWSTTWSSRFLPTEQSGPAGEVREPLDLLTDKHFQLLPPEGSEGEPLSSPAPRGWMSLTLVFASFLP